MDAKVPVTTNYRERLNKILATSKRKSYFVAAVTVLFAVAMFLLGILPSYSSLTLQAKENEKKDEVLNMMQTKLTTLKNLTAESEQKKDLVAFFSSAFPDSSSQEDVLNSILAFANSNKLYLSSVSFSDARRDKPLSVDFSVNDQIKSQVLSLFVEGKRDNILKFINDIEQSRRIFNIKSAIIVRKTGLELSANPERDHKLDLQVEIYYNDNTPPEGTSTTAQ